MAHPLQAPPAEARLVPLAAQGINAPLAAPPHAHLPIVVVVPGASAADVVHGRGARRAPEPFELLVEGEDGALGREGAVSGAAAAGREGAGLGGELVDGGGDGGGGGDGRGLDRLGEGVFGDFLVVAAAADAGVVVFAGGDDRLRVRGCDAEGEDGHFQVRVGWKWWMARRSSRWWKGEKSTSVVARWERVYQAEEAGSKSSREVFKSVLGASLPKLQRLRGILKI